MLLVVIIVLFGFAFFLLILFFQKDMPKYLWIKII